MAKAKGNEATLTVEKNATNEETKFETPVVDEVRVEAAKLAYDELGKELVGKVYLVSGKSKTGKALLSFLENDASFTSHEALGVVKAAEDVQTALDSKSKELFVTGLCIEALGYYLSKYTGKGLADAKHYKENLFTPINEAMSKINEDKQRAEAAQLEWAAAAQGVRVEDLKKD